MHPAPTVLAGRYRLGAPLGEGGSARVVEAHDLVLGVDRAVKLLSPAPGADRAALRRRLQAEARAMAGLQHPHILRVIDVGQDGDTDFIVTELARGGAVSGLLARGGPLPEARVREIGLQLLDALGAAHAAGVVHRDVKPQNVLLVEEGRVQLADFGIARTEDDELGTRTGAVMGSFAYMAPEQRIDASRVGPEADLYGLGCTLFALCTGETPVDLFAADAASPRWAGVPEGLRPAIFACTRHDPGDRPGSASAAAEVLRAGRGPVRAPAPVEPTRVAPPAAPRGGRGARRALLGGAGALLILGIGIWWGSQSSAPAPGGPAGRAEGAPASGSGEESTGGGAPGEGTSDAGGAAARRGRAGRPDAPASRAPRDGAPAGAGAAAPEPALAGSWRGSVGGAPAAMELQRGLGAAAGSWVGRIRFLPDGAWVELRGAGGADQVELRLEPPADGLRRCTVAPGPARRLEGRCAGDGGPRALQMVRASAEPGE